MALNLFYDAIDALQVDRSNMQVLPTARYVFAKQKQKKKQYSDVMIWDGAIAVVAGCKPIRVERDAGCLVEVEYLSQFQNEIHVGEQELVLPLQYGDVSGLKLID